MAFRFRISHVLALIVTATLICIYTSYSNSPMLIIFDKPQLANISSSNITKKSIGEVNITKTVVVSSVSSHVVHHIPNKKKIENQTIDRTTQGILTESIYQAGYDIPNIELCPELGKNLKVLVGIMSAPSHEDARKAIRQTWGHYALQKNIALAFVVGISKVESLNTITSGESTLYGDIIRGNFMDSYDNLTLKTISFLGWVDSYCSEAHFILKTDDDMFINFPKLLTFISSKEKSEKTIFGRLAKKWKPIRNRHSKYFVSTQQYSNPVFPDFTTGPAYLLTGDIVRAMYSTALKTTYLKLEDVFTTGVVAQSINVTRVHINEFINKRVPFNICNIKKSISIHMIKYHEQFDLWKRISDGRSKCK